MKKTPKKELIITIEEAETVTKKSNKTKGKDAKDPGHDHSFRRIKLKICLDKDPKAMTVVDLLELLLTYVIPRKDVRPEAKRLLYEYNSLLGVLFAASKGDIDIKGVKKESILLLKLCYEIAMRMKESEVLNKPVLSNYDTLLDYCRMSLAHEKTESLYAILLDQKLRLMSLELVQHGSIDQVQIEPQMIAALAIRKAAKAVILVHNHPSGSPKPSKEDIKTTEYLKMAFKPLKIHLFDSLVVGKEGVVSLLLEGLID